MKKNDNRGFTLIELLAIIVILAIIAVITVPLILGIINDAKLNSITDSAYGYKSAIQNYSMYLQTVDSTNPGIKGSYTVSELKTLGLEVKGQEPDCGVVLIDNEGISGCLKFEDYSSYLYNNQVINTAKGNCPIEKLVTEGDGLYKSTTDPGRLIYRGDNPNNRIFLKEDGTNNILYRIISYEVDGTIKVVRDERIGDKAWDIAGNRTASNGSTYCTSSAGCNVWGSQNDMLYNGESLGDNFHYSYYSDMTLANGLSGTVNSEASLNKFLNGKSDGNWQSAIKMDKYIDTHEFYVGGVYYIYNSTTVLDKGFQIEKSEEKLFTWNGKIGLPSITEFVESSTNPNCTSIYSNYGGNPNHDGWPCSINNYNYKSSYSQWLINAFSSSKHQAWFLNRSGNFGQWDNTNNLYGVRPAFYLKSGISLSGTGSTGDEYKIIEM